MSNRTELIQPPPDVLAVVIPPQVRDGWRTNPTPELLRRLEFLAACGPRPSNEEAWMRLMHCRAVRAAWETYVYSAYACGFFEGKRGRELRGRLASRDPDDFRSAMAECLACWFLAGKHQFVVTADAPGRGAKVLDMAAVIVDQDVGIEVKAPRREMPSAGEAWSGHDSDLLCHCLDAANKQFTDDVPNILVLVPELRTPVYQLRVQLVTALYGEEKITCLIDTRTGGPAGPVTTEFFPEGKLLRRRQPSGALIKPDGSPSFTRISAVIVIEEDMQERFPPPNPLLLADEETAHQIWPLWKRASDLYRGHDNVAWIDHHILVAHNPFACHPLNTELFTEHIQFKDLGGGFGWSDGEPL